MWRTLFIVGLILATSLGLFGQDVAYFLDTHIGVFHPLSYLTAITILSILLYIINFIQLCLLLIKNKLKGKRFMTYLTVTLLLGIPTSLWSIFVLAMWWG